MSDAQSSFKAGFQAYTTGDYAGAIAGFERALAIDPDHRESLRSIAMAWIKQGDPQRAVPYATRLAEVEPNDAMSWTGLSLVLMRAGRPKEAEDAAAKAKVQTWKVQLKQKPSDAAPATGPLQVLESQSGTPGTSSMPTAPVMPTFKPAPPPTRAPTPDPAPAPPTAPDGPADP